MTRLTVHIMSDDFLNDDALETGLPLPVEEDDLDMGLTPDGEPIAGAPNDPSEEDGFSTEDEPETF